MYDGGKILTGLLIFFALVTMPFWGNAVSGEAAKPNLKIVTSEKECVQDKEVMREKHMEILNEWRDTVVRQGRRTYVDAHGKTVLMSLSQTCMNCHPNKAEFCDQCHNYLAVDPYCWECHVEPKETP